MGTENCNQVLSVERFRKWNFEVARKYFVNKETKTGIATYISELVDLFNKT
jgi:hypothetical protein